MRRRIVLVVDAEYFKDAVGDELAKRAIENDTAVQIALVKVSTVDVCHCETSLDFVPQYRTVTLK